MSDPFNTSKNKVYLRVLPKTPDEIRKIKNMLERHSLADEPPVPQKGPESFFPGDDTLIPIQTHTFQLGSFVAELIDREEVAFKITPYSDFLTPQCARCSSTICVFGRQEHEDQKQKRTNPISL